ncbi:MAG: Alternative cytochrome c oxidase subunit 2 [Candidatus Omnitrophica bacterium]|nr:Alternative cytochrome c oxidase subunit 2 [Candidatus Omnitrophota bacterium]
MDKYYGWGLPIDISTHGHAIDRLINLLHVFMIVMFVGWFAFFIIALVRFRQRPGHKASYETKHFKAPTYLEIGVAVFEIVLLAGFSMPVWTALKTALPDKSKAVQVRVIAQQFAWNIHYPGPDGVFGKTDPKLIDASNPIGLDRASASAADDIVTVNQLNVPVSAPVLVQLSSKDVIHSFSLQVMRIKQDAIPGQSIPVWFEAKKTGQFEIACAQLCGLGHYRMRGFFNVQEQEDFQKWLAEQAPKA